MSFWELVLTDHGRLVLAGLFGSAIAVVMDWTGFIPAIRRLVVGSVVSYFTYELAVPVTKAFLGVFGAPTEPSISLSGFLMGVCGVVFVESLMLAGKKFRGRFEK